MIVSVSNICTDKRDVQLYTPHLSMSVMTASPSSLVIPYLKVIKSGCFFFDVIFIMDDKLLVATMSPSLLLRVKSKGIDKDKL